MDNGVTPTKKQIAYPSIRIVLLIGYVVGITTDIIIGYVTWRI